MVVSALAAASAKPDTVAGAVCRANALGVLFFAALDSAFAGGSAPRAAYGEGFIAILPWQIACYVSAAALMFLLPKRPAGSPDNPWGRFEVPWAARFASMPSRR